MILPGKHLKHDRALIGIGSQILEVIEDEYTVSELWEHVQVSRLPQASPLSYDWFILALSFLYMIGAIDYDHGLISIGGGL
ncbi:MAG: ABC-three component system middle component 6 [Candidatus Sedimenticola sp. 6PFRAG7]